jgi:Protein of unknown function (DUF664)
MGSAALDLKAELHRKLQISRAAMLAKLDGLGEYDRRRPMTATGTNLLGLIKHLTGVEFVYFGDSFGRPMTQTMPCAVDGSIWDGADMWATPEETTEYITGMYREAWAHSDQTIASLDLNAPGSVPHWPADRRDTTLGVLLIRVLEDTAQHAGQADILRELIDGTNGAGLDEATQRALVNRIAGAAETFRA